MSRQFTDFGFAPEPWTAFDVVMVFVGTMANRFSDFNTEIDNLGLLTALKDKHGAAAGQAIFDELKWVVDPDAPTTVPKSAGPKRRRRERKTRRCASLKPSWRRTTGSRAR